MTELRNGQGNAPTFGVPLSGEFGNTGVDGYASKF
jgi:hypothetical protein